MSNTCSLEIPNHKKTKPKILVESDQVYGRWKVIDPKPVQETTRNKLATCICECGTTKTVYQSRLISGASKSCGCLRDHLSSARKLTHGMSYSLEYGIYRAMLKRCYNSTHPSFKRHGGRGIQVSDSWRSGFEAFIADMGARPSTSHTLERVDNSGHYSKENCVWATWETQNNNKRDNCNLTAFGETMSVSKWARKLGIGRATINHRIWRGWSVEDALSKPVGTYMNKRGRK